MVMLDIINPTPLWQWIGIVCGILAFIVAILALPTLFQMFFGQPKLNIRFERGVDGAIRWLQVFLDNPPIKNAFLKKMRVRRDTIQGLTCQFRVKEFGSGRIILPNRQIKIYTDDSDQARFRISLPPTFSVAANAMLIMWDEKENQAVLSPNSDSEPKHMIQPGYYEADILLLVDGNPVMKSRRFVVGKNAEDLCWTNE